MKTVVLFPGGGLVDFSFPRPPVAVVDKEPWALSAYAANHSGKTRRILADLLKNNPEQVCEEMGVSGCDLLWSSPPCQPWSVSNGQKKEHYDPRMPTLLVTPKYMRILNPKFAVIENVRGLVDRRPGKTWYRWLLQDLRDAGYSVADEACRLNALNFDGCQIRRRIFIIAKRGRGSIPPPPQAPFPYKPLTVRDVIGGLTEEEALAVGLLPMSGSWKERLATTRPGEPLFGTKNLRMQWDGYCEPLRTSPCLERDPLHIHPEQPRFLSVREFAYLMGVPAYVFPATMRLRDRYRVIGQGVPPYLARVVVERLYECF